MLILNYSFLKLSKMPLVERFVDFPDDDETVEQKLIALRESIVFLIDGTVPMFNYENGTSYFQQCLEVNIFRK